MLLNLLVIKMRYSLEVYQDGRLIFFDEGKWLYPLFQLEEFLQTAGVNSAEITVHDRIVGRASALIITHLKIQRIYAGILSLPGKEILEKFGIEFQFDQLVERIQCATETLLLNEFNPEKGYRLVKERMKK
ncbi:MAG: hypothetical protein Kow0042_31170 [Calditrichia bacterium]